MQMEVNKLQVYILDVQSPSREQVLRWLVENPKVNGVKVFDDYQRFLDYVKKSPPGLCFIRLGHVAIPGMKTARIVKTFYPDIRIIFVSDDRDYALEAYELGVHGYLLSPIDKIKLKLYIDNK